MYKYIVLLIASFLFHTFVFSQEFELYNNVPVESKRIVFKYAPLLKSSAITTPEGIGQNHDFVLFESILQQIQAEKPRQLFPVFVMPDSCENCVDISRIYECYYSANIPISQALAMFRNCAGIEYAEPVYLEQELFVPDDPEMAQQWHMNSCKIYQAWDIETGDTSVVIGITDSGFEISHLDLINQIKYNYNDPINGQDDDYDGYVDNFRGWDFGAKDNNPTSTTSDHGTWVAGISNAQVNNAFATAGVAYNCKFIPIKVATDQGYITRGYEGIVYAANQKCDIINCSWGSVGSYSKFSQDIIQYATYNCNALVIAAAGNNNNTDIFYPASYTNVFSVGGSDLGDTRWENSETSGSNWNYYVDIVAPACGYRTLHKNNGTVAVGGGTSFAAPIVSGIAALVKSAHPTVSALELGERIRVTADNIYGIESNQKYLHLLGSGRVNALKAITDSVTPSVRMCNVSAINKNGSYKYFPGDTLLLTITFKNYLADATNLFVSVSCENSFIAPIQGSELFPTFNKNEEKTIDFSFEIVETLPADVQTMFKITCSAEKYFGFEYFPLLFNPSYYDFEIGNFSATATANGTIGVLSPNKRVENGIMYKKNPCMLHEGSLLIEKPNEKVAACVREQNGFTIKNFPTVHTADSVDILIKSAYYNANMDINVEQFIYGWNTIDALVHEYRISHNADSTYHNIRVGAYIDWLIVAQTYNKMNYIDSLQLGYAYSIDPWGFYGGILPLHYHQTNFYAIDDAVGLDNNIYIADGFSDKEIRYGLYNSKHSAGNYTDGGMVSSISGALIPKLDADSTAIVRYAIIAAETLQELVETARIIRANYSIDTSTYTAVSKTLHEQIYTHYFANTIHISCPAQKSPSRIVLYNSLGIKVYETTIEAYSPEQIHINCSHLASGIYIVSIENIETKYNEKIHVYK